MLSLNLRKIHQISLVFTAILCTFWSIHSVGQTAGLVAAYNFNEGSGSTVTDLSGHNLTGTIVGATWTNQGKYGNALSFNGTSSYVDLGNSAALQLTSSMTLEAWVKAAANPSSDGQIVTKSDNSSGWQLKTTTDAGPQNFNVTVTSSSGARVKRFSSTARALNTWYHVAGVYDASAHTLTIYINGVLESGTLQGTVPTANLNAAVNANIGRRTGGYYFNGLIDEVRIYNRALSATEIQSDMNTPLGGGTTPPSDTQAPTAPANLAAAATSSSAINLNWSASTDNVGVTGYLVERCQGAGCTSFTQIAMPTTTSFSNTGLSAATSYSYRVRAIDAAGNLSPYSGISSATTSSTGSSDVQPPTAPGNLTAAANGSAIQLNWNPSSDNVGVSGYKVERCQGSGCTNFAEITTTQADSGAITRPLSASVSHPNYFVDSTGTPVALNGSHTWNNFQDWGANGSPQTLDFNAYVNFLTAHGQNFTLLWRTELTKFCGLPTTASAPPDFTVTSQPWQRTGPGNASDGKLKFDLSKFDQSYFDRLRARVVALNNAGIYTGVYMFSGEWLASFRCSGDGYPFTGTNNVNGIDDGYPNSKTSSMTMTSPNAMTAFQDAYVEKVIDTLNDLPNVLWIISEEATPDTIWWENHQISHIHTYESSKPSQHPVGFGVMNDFNDTTITNSDADWIAPFVKVSPTSSCGSGTPRCKVNINDSDHSNYGMWNATDQNNRAYAWQNFMNGNQVAFMDPYVVNYPRENRNNCVSPVNSICSAPAARWNNFRDNLGYIVKYSRKLNLANVTPQSSICSSGTCLAQTPSTGAEYLAYSPNGGSFTVNLSAMPSSRSLSVEWLNPSTGAITTGSSVAAGATRTFTPPFTGDAVLYLVDTAGHAGPSGGALADEAVTTSTTTYMDSNVVAGVTYNYRVQAADPSGNMSSYSNSASAAVSGGTTSDTQAPTAPANLNATATSASTISLAWTAATDNVGVTGYRVERCQGIGCSTFAQVGTSTGTSYSDSGLSASTSYGYRVRANDAAGNLSSYSNIGTATTSTATTSAGLVAAYSMNEGSGTTITDLSGNGITGTLQGATWTTGGKYGNALSFNGTSSYVDLGNPTALQLTGSMTVEAWVNAATNPADDGQIVAKANSNGGWQLKTSPDTGPQTFGMQVGGSSLGQRYSKTTRALNTWYHVAGVYNASTRAIDVYVNGVLDSGTLRGTIPASQILQSVNVNIGRRSGGYYFNGVIDEIRIYNRALSQTEIQNDMNTPLGSGSTTPPADTQSPTPPSLTATTASSSQINLSWTTSTDNVGVTGYRVESCAGSGCSNFVQIATPTTTTFSNTGLTAGTSYSYRVRATDAAGNLSSYSNVATTTTTAAAPTAPSITQQPASKTVTTGQTATFTVTASGTAPLSYQWQKGTTNITGATASSYTTPATTTADNGSQFRVIVSNAGGSATSSAATLTVNTATTTAVDVLTYHNDNGRTGQNLNETTLTPANVNSAQFGKIATLSVTGRVDAQPLYASNVVVPGNGTHNLLIVATEHATVYAFDTATWAIVWQKSMLATGESPSDDRGCSQVSPEIGVTATPVIDRSRGANGVIYVVAMSKNGSTYHHRLHALDLATGAELFSGPKEITATYPGNGDGTNGTNVVFDPKQYKERAGLLLMNGTIHTAWASHCDVTPYTGWLMSYNADTLAQTSVLNVTPNGSMGAIWMAGAGLAGDNSGNYYFLDGNGDFDTTMNASGFPSNGNFGNAFIKISTTGSSLAVADYFEMSNGVSESAADQDLGSGGAMVLPDLTDATGAVKHLAVGVGKDAHMYVVNRDNMGKFSPSANNIYQDISGVLAGGVFAMPAYFNGKVYYGAVSDSLKAFTVTNARFSTSSTAHTTTTFSYPGSTPSISANGNTNGIVWAIQNNGSSVLHAYDAITLNELYNTSQMSSRDSVGTNNKYITPTIVNGKVFVGTTNSVVVYGPIQ